MTDSNNPHSQFELFPKDSRVSEPDSVPFRTRIKDLTLSIENIIVLGIILVMTLVLFFSFGVERGKRLVDSPQEFNTHGADDSKPFVREEAQTVEITIDTADLVSEKEDAAKEHEVISVPLERELTDEQLFTIQVASFKLEKNARKEADRLGHIGTDIFVQDKGNYSIVCVGKFLEREQATKFSKQLKSKYRDLLVRRF